MNKPITVIGIALIILGGIGAIYVLEFSVGVIIGIALVIIGIALGSGRFSKRAITTDPAVEFCTNCGSAVTKGTTKFCPYCQKEL